jgi:hypothetical protein
MTKFLAQSESEACIKRAGVGVHIIGLLVSLLAVCVASGAAHGGAARITGLHGEARLDKVRSGVEINGGHIPVDSAAVLGVLELEDAALALSGGHLDGDTATVGVGVPLLAVVAASRADGLHGAGAGVGAPQVHVGVHVVDDLDAAAGAAGLDVGFGITGPVGLGKGDGSSCQEAGHEDVESHIAGLQK